MFVRVFAPFLDLSNLRIEPSLSPTEGEIVTLWPFQSRKPAQSQRGQVQCTLQWTLEQCWWPFQTRKGRNRGRLGRVWWGDIYLRIAERGWLHFKSVLECWNMVGRNSTSSLANCCLRKMWAIWRAVPPLAENWRPASILIVICIPASRHIAFEQIKGTLNHVYKYEVQIQLQMNTNMYDRHSMLIY